MNTGAHPPLGELSGSELEKQGGSDTRTGVHTAELHFDRRLMGCGSLKQR